SSSLPRPPPSSTLFPYTTLFRSELNFRLARPLHPAHEAVAENIAYKARTAGMILVVWLVVSLVWPAVRLPVAPGRWALTAAAVLDRKSTRLNSSHLGISYAVFCL